jgi:hypothetical protein
MWHFCNSLFPINAILPPPPPTLNLIPSSSCKTPSHVPICSKNNKLFTHHWHTFLGTPNAFSDRTTISSPVRLFHQNCLWCYSNCVRKYLLARLWHCKYECKMRRRRFSQRCWLRFRVFRDMTPWHRIILSVVIQFTLNGCKTWSGLSWLRMWSICERHE